MITRVGDAPVFRMPTTSHAVVHRGLVYVTGVLATDGDSFDKIGAGIVAETEQAVSNIEHVLSAAGSALAELLKVTVYLTDVSTFLDMESVYARLITSQPARTTVYVSQLPMGAAIEIDAIAAVIQTQDC